MLFPSNYSIFNKTYLCEDDFWGIAHTRGEPGELSQPLDGIVSAFVWNCLSLWLELSQPLAGIVSTFLHSPFCRAEGLCQHATIQEGLVEMLNGPIRVKQINQSSSVIG